MDCSEQLLDLLGGEDFTIMTKSYKAHVWAICDQTDDDNNTDELSVVIKSDMGGKNLGHDFYINKGQERGVGSYDFDEVLTIALLEKDPKKNSWLSKPLNFIADQTNKLHNLATFGLDKLGVPKSMTPSPGIIFEYTATEMQKKNLKPLGATYIHLSDAARASRTYQYKTVNTSGTPARYRIKYRIDILKPAASGTSSTSTPVGYQSSVYKAQALGVAPTNVATGGSLFNVVKRDGNIQSFNQTKYAASMTLAGATPQQANLVSNRVISRIGNQPSISSKVLSSMTARSLSRVNTTASRNYIAYRNQKSSR
jgi:hypothetical protein